jgi:hypothetical protein
MGHDSWLWDSPRWLKGEHGAERLDLMVSLTFPVIQTAKRERTGAPDRPRPPERSAASSWDARKQLGCEKAAGMRESSIGGDTSSAMQPILGMRVRPSTQNTMVEWRVQANPKGAGGAAAMTPNPALHTAWRDRPAVVRRPRPHRGRVAARSWRHWHRSPPMPR